MGGRPGIENPIVVGTPTRLWGSHQRHMINVGDTCGFGVSVSVNSVSVVRRSRFGGGVGGVGRVSGWRDIPLRTIGHISTSRSPTTLDGMPLLFTVSADHLTIVSRAS